MGKYLTEYLEWFFAVSRGSRSVENLGSPLATVPLNRDRDVNVVFARWRDGLGGEERKRSRRVLRLELEEKSFYLAG